MAIYDVNAAIQKPNIVNAMQQGFMFGSQQRQMREQREREAQLNALAPGVIGGDPQAYAQAAAVDPQRAQQFQQAGDVNLRRMKGAVEFINRARQSGNPQAVNAALRAAKPYLSQYANGAVIPDEWTPEMEQGWPGFEAKVAMLGGQSDAAEPAGFRQAHLTAIAAGYQPGTPEYQKAMQVAAGTAPRAIPPGFTTRAYRDANGQEVVELVQVRGEGAGQAQAVPAPQMPAQAPQQSMAASGGDPQMDALAQAANAMIRAGVPAEQVDAFLMQSAQASPNVQVNPPGMMPMGNAQPQLPPINELGGGPVAPLRGSGRGQTDADRARAEAMKAAAVERARIEAQLSMAPQQAAADAAREGAVTTAREGATNQAKRDAVQATNNTAFAQYTAARDTLLADLKGTMTGPVAGRLPAVTERQQIAEGAQARMAPILKGLFRTAGEGTFTDKDQELLMAMVPTRTDLPGAVEAKIAGIDAIIQAKLQQAPAQAPDADAAPVEGARKAPDGNWYVQRDGRYFKVEP